MVVEREYGGPVQGAIHDLRTLHRLWMTVVFPQLRQDHAVLGRWKPETGRQRAVYYAWGVLGGLALAVAYPLLLVGLATRFHSRRFDSAATRLGLVGVVGVTAVVWGLLTLLARIRFSPTGFVAVAAASVVAVVSAGLAWLFVRVDGRPVTVLLAYPAAMNAVFLPPVVAALYSPTLADVVFPSSTSLAIWLLDNVLVVGDLNTFFRETFELEGVLYVAMWFGIAVPLGWFLGTVVTVADLVRPKGRKDTDADKVG
jgi:hypothetical protein